jgi:hypothetical protein
MAKSRPDHSRACGRPTSSWRPLGRKNLRQNDLGTEPCARRLARRTAGPSVRRPAMTSDRSFFSAPSVTREQLHQSLEIRPWTLCTAGSDFPLLLNSGDERTQIRSSNRASRVRDRARAWHCRNPRTRPTDSPCNRARVAIRREMAPQRSSDPPLGDCR